MAITSYVGLNGSGKTYGAMEFVVLPAVKQGREIITNAAIYPDKLQQLNKKAVIRKVDNDEMKALIKEPVPGAVYLIDESWEFWPAGLKAVNIPDEDKLFFTMHRHRSKDKWGTEIVMMTQGNDQLCAFVRNLVQRTVLSVNLEDSGMPNRYRVEIYRGAVTGQTPPKSQMIRQIGPNKYKPEVYQYYKSQSQSEEHGEERRTDRRGSIWRSGFVMFGAPLALLALISGISWTYHLFHSPRAWEKSPPKVSATAAPAVARSVPASTPVHMHPVQAVQSKPKKPHKPSPSKTWQLVASIHYRGQHVYVIQNRVNYRRISPKRCKTTEAGDVQCVVDGQLVAIWTGPDQGGLGIAPVNRSK
ncbi:MAG: zonular occludens toxin domain-containing protein [Acidihalobacter sp.]|uniref:zonular occludens toxin domain-containing protein n=1 Tax=Acidihalobacter sp. TaxID=1872108 RepID=UPI00307E11F7